MSTYPGTTGTTLNFNQVQALWIANGGDPKWAPTMAAIAAAESGGTTNNLNNNPGTGDYSVGLWQINYFGGLASSRTASYGNPQALAQDPNAQAKAAIALFNNGKGWANWQADLPARLVANGKPLPLSSAVSSVAGDFPGYVAGALDPNGPALTQLEQLGQQLATSFAGLTSGPGGYYQPPGAPASPQSGATFSFGGLTFSFNGTGWVLLPPQVQNPSAIGGVTPNNDVPNPLAPLQSTASVISSIGSVISDVTNPASWRRLGIFAGGAALFVIGLALFVSTTDTGKTIETQAANGAVMAAFA